MIAQKWFYQIWTGEDTIVEMRQELQCTNVVMMFPARSQHNLTYLALVLRNLAQHYCAQTHNLVEEDWNLGILFNVHKFPVDEHSNKQIQVGLNLAHGTEILHQSTWGFIEEVAVLTPSKAG